MEFKNRPRDKQSLALEVESFCGARGNIVRIRPTLQTEPIPEEVIRLIEELSKREAAAPSCEPKETTARRSHTIPDILVITRSVAEEMM